MLLKDICDSHNPALEWETYDTKPFGLVSQTIVTSYGSSDTATQDGAESSGLRSNQHL